MPSSTRSNKETQLLFSSDPACLERSIRKEVCSSSIDNNTCSSLDFRQLPSTQALVLSTDTRSTPLTKDTHLPSTDIFRPTSIDTSVLASIDTEPRDMVATLILVRHERGDLHDQEGHLRNAAGDDLWQVVMQERLQEGDFEEESSTSFGRSHWCRSTPEFEHRSTDFNPNRSTYGVNRILHCREDSDSQGVRSKTPTSAQPCIRQNRSTFRYSHRSTA
ncbi:hypothetical protein F2Q69_00023239 [Brassica cretica]|uniref:Uncharacterized protein n=1 Tax=Brassica cretica TaxID=69181 RepID=A0A8S9QB51_BRACR|nr:hypothetical protein F2Q69_00023239 [Brassica cretica]